MTEKRNPLFLPVETRPAKDIKRGVNRRLTERQQRIFQRSLDSVSPGRIPQPTDPRIRLSQAEIDAEIARRSGAGTGISTRQFLGNVAGGIGEALSLEGVPTPTIGGAAELALRSGLNVFEGFIAGRVPTSERGFGESTSSRSFFGLRGEDVGPVNVKKMEVNVAAQQALLDAGVSEDDPRMIALKNQFSQVEAHGELSRDGIRFGTPSWGARVESLRNLPLTTRITADILMDPFFRVSDPITIVGLAREVLSNPGFYIRSVRNAAENVLKSPEVKAAAEAARTKRLQQTPEQARRALGLRSAADAAAAGEPSGWKSRVPAGAAPIRLPSDLAPLRVKKFLDDALQKKSKATNTRLEKAGFKFDTLAGASPDQYFLAVQVPKEIRGIDRLRGALEKLGVPNADEVSGDLIRRGIGSREKGGVTKENLYFSGFDQLDDFIRTGTYEPPTIDITPTRGAKPIIEAKQFAEVSPRRVRRPRGELVSRPEPVTPAAPTAPITPAAARVGAAAKTPAQRAAQEAAAGVEVSRKEPWQMTKEEYGKAEWDAINLQIINERSDLRSGKMETGPFSRYRSKAAGLRAVAKDLQEITRRRNELGYGAFGDHYGEVSKAIREGKPVPAEVLAEHPDLAARAAAAAADVPTTAARGAAARVTPDIAAERLASARRQLEFLKENPRDPALSEAGVRFIEEGGISDLDAASRELAAAPFFRGGDSRDVTRWLTEKGRELVTPAAAAADVPTAPVARGAEVSPAAVTPDVPEGRDIVDRLFASFARGDENRRLREEFVSQRLRPVFRERFGDDPVMEISQRQGEEPLLSVSTAGWRERVEQLGFEYVDSPGFVDRYRIPGLPAVQAATDVPATPAAARVGEDTFQPRATQEQIDNSLLSYPGTESLSGMVSIDPNFVVTRYASHIPPGSIGPTKEGGIQAYNISGSPSEIASVSDKFKAGKDQKVVWLQSPANPNDPYVVDLSRLNPANVGAEASGYINAGDIPPSALVRTPADVPTTAARVAAAEVTPKQIAARARLSAISEPKPDLTAKTAVEQSASVEVPKSSTPETPSEIPVRSPQEPIVPDEVVPIEQGPPPPPIDDGNLRIPPSDPPPPSDIPPPGPHLLSDLQNVDEVAEISFRPDVFRRIAQLPLMRTLFGTLNPAGVAKTVDQRFFAVRAQLRHDGRLRTVTAMQSVKRLRGEESIFGPRDVKGMLTTGPLKGKHLNDVRTFPNKHPLTPEMRAWVDAMNELEESKLALLKRAGVEVNELHFEEGGRYAGRRIAAKLGTDGELLETASIGMGPSLAGRKPGFLKGRVFKTAEEAADAGFVTMLEEDALALNIQASYNYLADLDATDWFFRQGVKYRNSAVPEALRAAREGNARNLATAKRAILALQRAIRGETLPTGTVKSIERIFPELKGKLREPTRLRIEDVLRAARSLEEPPKVFEVPKPGAIKKVQKLIEAAEARLLEDPGNASIQRELSRLQRSLGFIRYRIALGEPLTILKNPVKELRAGALSDLQEMLDAIRGVRTKVPGKKTPQFRGGLIERVQRETRETEQALKRAREALVSPRYGEAMVSDPAFAGKILTGPEAKELADRLIRGLHPDNNSFLSNVLRPINKVNSLGRALELAADSSLFPIQLVFAAGRPKIWGKAGVGFVRGLVSPRYHANLLSNNADLLRPTRRIVLSADGTEFTEAAQRGGALQVRLPQARVLGPLAGRQPLAVPATVLKPFVRAYEAAMDTAGIEMLKAFQHRMTTPARRADVEDFINEFRGLASSKKVGVSPMWQQTESFTILAARYNRAIAAIVADMFRGGLRGELARESMVRAIAAVAAMSVAVSLARGETLEEATEHLNPFSGDFMTWDVFGQRVGPGSKVRSLVVLLARSIEDPRSLLELTMENPGLRFVRGNLSPVLSKGTDLLSGRNFIGDPTRDGYLSFTREIAAPFFMPLWIASFALEGGDLAGRTTRGVADFFGFRGYPESAIGAFIRYAEETSGKKWEEMTKLERDRIKKIDSQGRELWQNFVRDQEHRGRTGRLMSRFHDHRMVRLEGLESAAEQARQNGDFQGLREEIVRLGSEYGARISGLETDPTLTQEWAELRKIPDDEMPGDAAYRLYQEIVGDPELDLGIEGYDFAERDRRLDELRGRVGEGVWSEVMEHLRLNRIEYPPEVQRYYMDQEMLRPYWEAGNDLKFQNSAIQDVWDEYVAGSKFKKGQLEEGKFGGDLRKILAMRANIRLNMRTQNPDMDAALVRWYGREPRTQAGLQAKSNQIVEPDPIRQTAADRIRERVKAVA